mmetsp:Transcript_60774/g.104693  ORF Transcript_60774/g.104693 Transcript_60774/m.104693 type:complete len:431 (+) Transcript_60774:65-1357(+)
MHACEGGWTELASYLVREARADPRHTDLQGSTSLRTACGKGNLDVAQWLVSPSGGAFNDLQVSNLYGSTPFSVAYLEGHFNVASWLVLQGALNEAVHSGEEDEEEVAPARTAAASHVSPALVLRDTGSRGLYTSDRRPALLAWALEAVQLHRVFTRLVLPAAASQSFQSQRGGDNLPSRIDADERSDGNAIDLENSANQEKLKVLRRQNHEASSSTDTPISPSAMEAPPTPANEDSLARQPTFHPLPPLATLGGSGEVEGLWRTVADFAGVLRGREVRNCREFAQTLEEILQNEKNSAAANTSVVSDSTTGGASKAGSILSRRIGEPIQKERRLENRHELAAGFFACENGKEFKRTSTGSLSSSSRSGNSPGSASPSEPVAFSSSTAFSSSVSPTHPRLSEGRRLAGILSPADLSGTMKGGSASGIWDEL